MDSPSSHLAENSDCNSSAECEERQSLLECYFIGIVVGRWPRENNLNMGISLPKWATDRFLRSHIQNRDEHFLVTRAIDTRFISIDYRYMERLFVTVTRLALVGFSALVWGLMFAGVAFGNSVGDDNPELGNLVLPYAVTWCLFLLSMQVVLLALWKLVGLHNDNSLISLESRRFCKLLWIGLLTGSGTAIGTLFHLVFIARTGGPLGLIFLVLGVMLWIVGSAALAILGKLLDISIAQHAELAEVI